MKKAYTAGFVQFTVSVSIEDFTELERICGILAEQGLPPSFRSRIVAHGLPATLKPMKNMKPDELVRYVLALRAESCTSVSTESKSRQK